VKREKKNQEGTRNTSGSGGKGESQNDGKQERTERTYPGGVEGEGQNGIANRGKKN